MQHLNMEKLAGGAFSEQVNRAIEEVTMNIQDPNTDDKKVRKVTITLSFKPNAQRNFSTIGIDTKVSLAPTLGVVTAMSMGKDIKTGVNLGTRSSFADIAATIQDIFEVEQKTSGVSFKKEVMS